MHGIVSSTENDMNKKVIVSAFGGPEALVLHDAAIPQPEADEIIIKTAFAGVGAVDVMMRQGALKEVNLQPPFTPGIEVSGWVEAVGSDVQGFEPGQAVASMMMPDGGYAEYARAKASLSVILPSDDALEPAASIVNLTTAYLLLTYSSKLQDKSSVLVHGAAGGLGTATIQVLKALAPHAHVTATVRDATKAQQAKSIGSDTVVTSTDFLQGAHATSYDLIIDPVGGDTRRRSIELLKPYGTLLAVGNVSDDFDSKISSQDLWLGGKTVSGFNLALFASLHSREVQQAMHYIVQALADQTIPATPAQVFNFEEVQQVHERMEQSKIKARAILRVS